MASKFITVAKLLHSSHRSSGRLYFSSSSSATPDDLPLKSLKDSSPNNPIRSTSLAELNHPLFSGGTRTMLNIDEYDEEAIVKVDMPGIGKAGLDVAVKKNAIHFVGKAEKGAADYGGLPPREYSGIVRLPAGIYSTNQITASIKFGVLKLVIPRRSSEEMEDSSRAPPPVVFDGLRDEMV